jgi:hypothetical protein
MVNVKNKTCIFDGCRTIPAFNILGESKALYCSIHKKDDMVNVISKTCIFDGCRTQSNFNILGQTIPLYCSIHKKDDMVNVISKKCIGDNCLIRGNRNYKGYCTYCFQHLFPNDPKALQIKCKTKEIAVRDFINTNYEGFQHDKPLYIGDCNCSNRRRIDHRKLINNTILAIETDEFQHKNYIKDDEISRYNDLYMAFSAKFIFIRFNPDKYIENGKSLNPMLGKRLPILKIEIDKQIKRIEDNLNNELVEIVYLYYN